MNQNSSQQNLPIQTLPVQGLTISNIFMNLYIVVSLAIILKLVLDVQDMKTSLISQKENMERLTSNNQDTIKRLMKNHDVIQKRVDDSLFHTSTQIADTKQSILQTITTVATNNSGAIITACVVIILGIGAVYYNLNYNAAKTANAVNKTSGELSTNQLQTVSELIQNNSAASGQNTQEVLRTIGDVSTHLNANLDVLREGVENSRIQLLKSQSQSSFTLQKIEDNLRNLYSLLVNNDSVSTTSSSSDSVDIQSVVSNVAPSISQTVANTPASDAITTEGVTAAAELLTSPAAQPVIDLSAAFGQYSSTIL